MENEQTEFVLKIQWGNYCVHEFVYSTHEL